MHQYDYYSFPSQKSKYCWQKSIFGKSHPEISHLSISNFPNILHGDTMMMKQIICILVLVHQKLGRLQSYRIAQKSLRVEMVYVHQPSKNDLENDGMKVVASQPL